jgi:hypothetical protein
VSRFSLDDDSRDWDDVRPNATCTDCGIDFSRVEDDPGTRCDACCDQRDAWAAALELRMAAAPGRPLRAIA